MFDKLFLGLGTIVGFVNIVFNFYGGINYTLYLIVSVTLLGFGTLFYIMKTNGFKV